MIKRSTEGEDERDIEGEDERDREEDGRGCVAPFLTREGEL